MEERNVDKQNIKHFYGKMLVVNKNKSIRRKQRGKLITHNQSRTSYEMTTLKY